MINDGQHPKSRERDDDLHSFARAAVATPVNPAIPGRHYGHFAAAMATVGLASPAQAWSWSPVVDVIGLASCKTVPYAFDAPAVATWVYVHSTGEIAQQRVNWVGYWDGI